MKKNTALSGPLAVLMLPRSTKELLTVGKAVHDAMDGNPNFPSPNPPLSVFRANPVPETLQARTTIDGLPWAKVAYFRFRSLTRTGKGDYSQVVSLLVQ